MAEEKEKQLVFDVLLDKVQGTEFGELKAARFYKSVDWGVASSVEEVQTAGLLQIPTYALVNGRSFEGLDGTSWSQFHDTLGERLTLKVDRDYNDIPKGDYVVDIQGGGLVMPRPNLILEAIFNRTLVDGAMPISRQDKALLLGERQVYRFDGKKVQVVPVTHFFTSYEQFADVSKTEEFENALKDLSAVYVTIRPVSEARQLPSGFNHSIIQLCNPDLIIPCGSKARLNKMLMSIPAQKIYDEVYGWNDGRAAHNRVYHRNCFGSWHDGYKNVDTGRVGVLGDNFYYHFDMNFHLRFDKDGGSLGVAPETLRAWREALAREKQDLEARIKI